MPTIRTMQREMLCSFGRLAVSAAAAALLAAPALAQHTSVSVNIEIETRGPVHEAFAEPIVYDPDPGLVVPQAPPGVIEEAPPAEQPEGPSVTWIPGYWSWDDDRGGFVWVSGMWRNVPPGRQFVPGYWAKVPGGYQWVPGFWLTSSAQTVEYLPAPPEPLSLDPVAAAPAPDYTWVPGVWLWREGRYAWRAGYWLPPQAEWEWVPSHYVWTPSGYVFVNGYWDYAVRRRGLLFAPVYIERAALARRTFVYTPTVVIDAGLLVDNLFARPRYRHYYFGDYYAAEYRRAGIVPVYTLHNSAHGYSPLYEHALAVHRRTDPQWEHRFAREYDVRRDRADARPPRTWAALERARSEHHDAARAQTLAFARQLSDLTGGRDAHATPFRFQRVGSDQRDAYKRQLTHLRDYQEQRRKLELSSTDKSPVHVSGDNGGQSTQGQSHGGTTGGPAHVRTDRSSPKVETLPRGQHSVQGQESPRSVRLNLPRSPIVGREIKKADRTAAPPTRANAPKVNSAVRSKPQAQPGNGTQDQDKDDKGKDKGKARS